MLLKTIITRLSASRGNEAARGQETLVNTYVCKLHEANFINNSITLCQRLLFSVPHPPTYLSSYSCLLLARHQDLWQPARILLSACALTAEIKATMQEREGDRCCSCCWEWTTVRGREGVFVLHGKTHETTGMCALRVVVCRRLCRYASLCVHRQIAAI